MDTCATSVLCGLGMVEELNATPTVEGGRICQRKEGDVWQFCIWVRGEGLMGMSLKTTEKWMALAEAVLASARYVSVLVPGRCGVKRLVLLPSPAAL